MSFLVANSSSGATTSTTPQTQARPDLYLRYSSSVQGRPKAIGWGRNRVAVNCIWYAGFHPVAVTRSSDSPAPTSSGGKGFLSASSPSPSTSPTTTTTYKYRVDVIFSIGEGPVFGVSTIWRNKYAGPVLSLNLYGGTYGQAPASYLSQTYPGQALAYRGEAYLLGVNYNLGTSSSLPNISIEVAWGVNDGNGYDANPADVVYDFLTNPNYGIGFDPSLIGDLGPYRRYCAATSMLVSPLLTERTTGSAFLQDLLKATNTEPVWSSGKLTFLPYADQDEVGLGFTYTAAVAPVYDLTGDDFMALDDDSGTSISIARKPRADIVNRVRLEFFDRGQQYNPVTVEAVDEAGIIAYGEIPNDTQTAHMFCFDVAARRSAALQLHRAQIATTYTFKLTARFVLLDPMDIVTLTEPALGLAKQPVRIIEISEGDDSALTITAEEYHGTVTAPVYDIQPSAGLLVDFNADPGEILPPQIFEPPYLLAGELAVWCAVAGQTASVWGGCDVYASSDDASYALIGTIFGGARIGKTTGDLPAIAAVPTRATIDATNQLPVDLSASGGQLVSASQADMLAANNALLVGDEVIGFQTAALTGASAYRLSPLLRGAYDTDVAAHPSGSRVVRLDDTLFRMPFTTDRIGQTVYLKFASFNLYRGGERDLSSVGSIAYKITGSALAAAVASPQNIRTSFTSGFQQMSWDEVTDFRANIRYRIYRGDSFVAAQQVGDVAHPPFRLVGTGTYFVVAYCQPIPGLTVTSLPSAPLPIIGNMLVSNSLRIYDEMAAGWPGTRQNMTVQGAAPALYLALQPGQPTGRYTMPIAETIDLGYQGVLKLNASWKVVGASTSQDILSVADFLGQADVLGSAASRNVDSYVEISLLGVNDIFSVGDVFAQADVYYPAGWQRFEPGDFPGRTARFRISVFSSAPDVVAYLLNFSVQAAVETRLDHYQNLTIPAAGLTITFTPDRATVPAKFNGGPNGAALPYVNIAATGAQAGDLVQYSALSLSSVTINVTNGGVGVARTGFNVDVQGY